MATSGSGGKAATALSASHAVAAVSRMVAASSHSNSRLLLTLAVFSATPSANPPPGSINNSNGGSSHIAGIGDYFELKRYRNGSICLQAPCVGYRVVSVLRAALCAAPQSPSADPLPFITATQFGALFNVSSPIAEEALEALGAAGVLCRDDSNVGGSGGRAVDDATLTTLWTSPVFEDEGAAGRGRSNGSASARWYWNWFYPGAF